MVGMVYVQMTREKYIDRNVLILLGYMLVTTKMQICKYRKNQPPHTSLTVSETKNLTQPDCR